MSLEAATSIVTLVPTNPDGLDSKSEGDNHIRMLKSVLQASFPGLAGRLGRIQNKVSSYDLVLNDNWSVIFFTVGAGIQLRTAVSASVMGSGYYVTVVNTSADGVLFDPSGGETVNGTSTVTIPRGYMAHLWCDGSAWIAAVIPTGADVVAPGVVTSYAGVFPPAGWLVCNGALVSKALYPALFGVLGTSFGPGDASNFQLPDLRGRAVFGRDGDNTGRLTLVTGVNSAVLGAAGGSQYLHGHAHVDFGHAHTGNTGGQSASHYHANYIFGKDASGATPGLSATFSSDNSGTVSYAGENSSAIGSNDHYHSFTTNASFAAISTTGSGGSENLPPALILSMIIKT